MSDQFVSYVETHQERFLEELKDFLRLPSVAAHRRSIPETAAFVRQRLEQIGAQVQMIEPPDGAPLLYATVGSGNRRLMVYDHYDVQPSDPDELWTSPAFEPTIREGKLYARGIADNKGNLMLRIQAIEALQQTLGTLPCEVAFLIEGEEEVGSPSMPHVLEHHSSLIYGDGMLWETGERDIDDRPQVTCGVKGMAYVELVARGAAYDQHSQFATIVPNPAWRLVWALNTIKGADGRVQIAGFYDPIRPPTPAEEAALQSMPDTDEALLAELGLPAFLDNLRGVERLRRHLFEPTCNIAGFGAGYTGAGSKTVLPSAAQVKLDFRLVPDMQPDQVIQQLRQHLDQHGFSDIEILSHSNAYPARASLDSHLVQSLLASAETVYQTRPVLVPTMAGTGPMYDLAQQFGIPAASGAGCGYARHQIHAPNENVRLEDYWLAIRWMGQFITDFGA